METTESRADRAEFEAWELTQPWMSYPDFARSGDDSKYQDPVIEHAFRAWQASRATLPQAELYAEARQCDQCEHIGINDASGTDDTCGHCEWTGPSPKEDHCPECNRDGTMTAACPKCGGAYRFLADADLPVTQAAPSPASSQGWEPIETAPRDGTSILVAFGQDGVSQARYIPGLPHPWQFIDIEEAKPGKPWLMNYAVDSPGGPSHWKPMPEWVRPAPPPASVEGG